MGLCGIVNRAIYMASFTVSSPYYCTAMVRTFPGFDHKQGDAAGASGSKHMTDSAASAPVHWLQGIASELDGLRTVAVQRISRQVGLPTREEFEVQRGLLDNACERLARLEAQLDTLAARLGDDAR